MYTHLVTTQPLPGKKKTKTVSEAWPCSMVGLVINRGAVQEGCRMINWAQDPICNVLMKMKRGRRAVLEWWWYVCVGGGKVYFNEAKGQTTMLRLLCGRCACVVMCVTLTTSHFLALKVNTGNTTKAFKYLLFTSIQIIQPLQAQNHTLQLSFG